MRRIEERFKELHPGMDAAPEDLLRMAEE